MIRVSASAFDILWADVAHGAPPGVLTVPSVGRTDGERRAVRSEVYANLTDRGLYPGELDAALRERIEVLAQPALTVECELLLDLSESEPLRAVVAAGGGGRGALAVQPHRTIGLAAVGEGRTCAEAAAILPEVDGGPGRGVSLPADALTGGDPADGETTGSRARDRQVQEARAIQARPVVAAGQFSVRRRVGARLDRVGGLSWFLTDVGAYAASVQRGGDGRPWATVAPADRERVAARLADLAERSGGDTARAVPAAGASVPGAFGPAGVRTQPDGG